MNKRIITAIIIMMSISITGCGGVNGNQTETTSEITTAESDAATTEELDNEKEKIEENSEENTSNKVKWLTPQIKENLPKEQPKIADDLFTHVNYEWLRDTELRDGRKSASAFDSMADEVQETVQNLIVDEDIDEKYQIIQDTYYAFLDMDKRNEDGFSSVMPYVERIEAVKSIDEYLELILSDAEICRMTGVTGVAIDFDFEDGTMLVPTVNSVYLSLEDSAEYKELTDRGRLYKDAASVYWKKLLKKAGYSDKQADTYINSYFELETQMAEHIYDLETSYREDYVQMISNAYTKEELKKLAGDFPIEKLLISENVNSCDRFIVPEPEYIKALASIASEDNLDMLKAYSVIDILSYASDCTDEEANEISIEYINTISGVTGTKPIEEQAYDFVNDTYNELVGDMYARSTFTEEEKQAIEENVYDMIDIFRERMKVNDWLSEETRNTAIEKLNSMDVNIGYPEEMLNDFSGIKYDNNKDFFQNMLAIRSEDEKAWKFAAGKKFNKKAWGAIMSAATVNACYVPSQNSINFPAAILRKPYYDKDATLAYNMGGIGIVIGHEMSHAFDTNGSQYDKDGNLVNWWTDEDREAFRQRTKAVGERYAMYEILDGESPNADLVITETVADLAGTSVVLDLLAGKEKEGIQVNYEDFFIADATCWRRLLTKNVVQEKLKTDYHAPDFLRVNVNVSQFDKFYETFDIKEGDRMYTKPEDRLSVW